jgi:hypothetical protein
MRTDVGTSDKSALRSIFSALPNYYTVLSYAETAIHARADQSADEESLDSLGVAGAVVHDRDVLAAPRISAGVRGSAHTFRGDALAQRQILGAPDVRDPERRIPPCLSGRAGVPIPCGERLFAVRGEISERVVDFLLSPLRCIRSPPTKGVVILYIQPAIRLPRFLRQP